MLNPALNAIRGDINLPLKVLAVCVVVACLASCTLLDWGGIAVDAQTDLIGGASLLVLVVCVALGMTSERNFWILAPVVIIFVPNAVNHMFPSALMGKGAEAPPFSFFTHIDIYLFAGVLAHCDFRRPQPAARIFFGFIILSALTWVLTIAFAEGRGWVALFGSYQLRYAFLLFLLFCYANPIRYQNYFAYSLIVSLLLTCAEASAFTYVNGLDRFTSGNYGVNTFGALLAAGVAFLLYKRLPGLAKHVRYPLLILFLAACVATRTRFSLVALVVALAVGIALRRRKFSALILGAALFAVLLSAYLFYVPEGISMREGLVEVFGNLSDPQAIEITRQSSSMVTRLILWWATIHMILDHLWLGVGPGNWSYLKYNYGVYFDDILDMHQDLLNYLVSYGLVLGAVFYYTVFVYPLTILLRRKIFSRQYWGWYALILVFAVSGLTNAVTWKHEVAALVYCASLFICFGCSRRRVSVES